MLSLNNRACRLGLKATANGKEIDGSEIKTLTIELEDIPLDASELNALLSEPHAWDVLFNTGTNPPEPYLKCLKSLELREASEHAYVAIVYGLDQRQIVFTDAKISKIKLAPLEGGDTAMSCKVTATPVLDDSLAELFEQFGKSVECEIRAEPPGAQQDLPLNQFGKGADPRSSIGTPAQEREEAREIERKLAAELEARHNTGKPKRGRTPRARGADSVN